MSQQTNSGSGGIGFCGLMTVLFVGLKLTHYIDWSWWWVFSPLWIGIAFAIACLAIFGVIVFFIVTR